MGGKSWRWPQLPFEVENLFAVGSPLAMFLTVRGDILADPFPRGAPDYRFPGGAHLFNVFHPADPVAYRFEPLLDPAHARADPALVPARGSAEVDALFGPGAARALRIDYALQRSTGDSYSQYVSSLTFAAHWCYWESRDLVLFMQLILHRQAASQDFLETAEGRSWLRSADRLLNSFAADTPAEDLVRRGGSLLRAVGADLAHALDGGAEHLGQLRSSVRAAAGLHPAAAGDPAGLLPGGAAPPRGGAPAGAGRGGEAGEGGEEFKGQALAFLKRYLEKLAVPPIAGSRELSPGNEVSYALGSIVLSHVSIPAEHLVVSVVGRSVTVTATRISAALRNFTWIYKQKGFPWLKDSVASVPRHLAARTAARTPAARAEPPPAASRRAPPTQRSRASRSGSLSRPPPPPPTTTRRPAPSGGSSARAGTASRSARWRSSCTRPRRRGCTTCSSRSSPRASRPRSRTRSPPCSRPSSPASP